MKTHLAILTALALAGAALAQDSQAVMERDGVAEVTGGAIKLKSTSTEEIGIADFVLFNETGPLVIWYPGALIFKSGSLGGEGDKFTVLDSGSVHFQGNILGGGAAFWSSTVAINPHARSLEGNWTANGTTFTISGNATERGSQLTRWRGQAASDPATPEGGDMYWNTSNSTLRVHNGSGFINLN